MSDDPREPYRLRSTRTETAERIKSRMEARRQKWADYALFEDEPDDDLSQGDPSTNPYIPRSRRLRDRIRRMRDARGSGSYHEVMNLRAPQKERIRFRLYLGIIIAILLVSLWRHFKENSIKSTSYTISIEAEDTADQAASRLRDMVSKTPRFKLMESGGDMKIFLGATGLENGWTCYGFINTGKEYWKVFSGPTKDRRQCLNDLVRRLVKRLGISGKTSKDTPGE